MFKKHSRRSGFTLPEVLVTVAIVAVLAAMVVPAVTQQIGKGDDSNLTAGTQSVRTAITSFVADTRKFPGNVEDLYVRPTSTDDDAFGNEYGATAVGRWNGPYHVGSFATGATEIGFAILRDSLRAITAANVAYPDLEIGQLTLFLTIAGEARRLHADSLLDKGNGPATGDVQWTATLTDTAVVVKLLPAR
jgi:prepilin-type N-terminal cleavage/methylation domain-containing protein